MTAPASPSPIVFWAWADASDAAPVDCCSTWPAPCDFHAKFPAAVRSPLTTPGGNALAMIPPADPAAIATPPPPPPPVVVPSTPVVPPPAPASDLPAGP